MPIPDNTLIEKPLSAKERAKKHICEWIIDGTLQPGEKLNDAEIAKALGVSRTPVREALQILEQQGFVNMRPGVATYVSTVNPDDINKLLPPLAVLQALATETTAVNISPDKIDTLKSINRDFEISINNGAYYDALKIDEKFHDTIIEFCGNVYIENSVSMLQAHVRRFFFANTIHLSKTSVSEHDAIIEKLEQKDSAGAGLIAKQNWLRPVTEYEENNNT